MASCLRGTSRFWERRISAPTTPTPPLFTSVLFWPCENTFIAWLVDSQAQYARSLMPSLALSWYTSIHPTPHDPPSPGAIDPPGINNQRWCCPPTGPSIFLFFFFVVFLDEISTFLWAQTKKKNNQPISTPWRRFCLKKSSNDHDRRHINIILPGYHSAFIIITTKSWVTILK